MAAKSKKKALIRLVSTALNDKGKVTGYFVVRKKSHKLKQPFSFMKYDPIARKHALFKEKKIK